MNYLRLIKPNEKNFIFFNYNINNGCSMVKTVENGNIVKVDYTGTLANGTLFDTSIESEAKNAGLFNSERRYEPLEFEVGAGQVVKGFDQAVLGMKKGEEKNVEIKPEEGYGPIREELIQVLPKGNFASDYQAKEGDMIMFNTQYGQIRGLIKKIAADNITVDFNHPLAGKTLNFKIIMRNISK